MPTELEELVEFLHHGNTQIRQIATENLVPYSLSQPTIFKGKQLAPITDLKLLIRDYAPIVIHATTILINISGDSDILKNLAEDDKFVEALLGRIFDPKEAHADALTMLLANLAKSPSFERLIEQERKPVVKFPTQSSRTLAQLIELYNAGSGWNAKANFDYLGFIFGDLAKFPAFVQYLTTPLTAEAGAEASTALDPLTYFLPLTNHASSIRRIGTSLLLRNIALALSQSTRLIHPDHSVLPCLLLPLCSPDQSNISDEEMELLPEECQLLSADDHTQETDHKILLLQLETLYLIAARGGKDARKTMTETGAYVVVRELHLSKEDEQLREWCEKIVNILMADEPNSDAAKTVETSSVVKAEKSVTVGSSITERIADSSPQEDEDDLIIPIV